MRKHIHQYRRINIATVKGKEYWVMRCVKDNCTHYTPMASKLSAPRLWGMISLCNRCENEFELDRRALRMAEPCCFTCVERKETDISDAAKFFEELERNLGK